LEALTLLSFAVFLHAVGLAQPRRLSAEERTAELKKELNLRRSRLKR
jgi:hypothetical protein